LRETIDSLLDETDRLMVEARQLPDVLRDLRLRAESATIVRLADRMIASLRKRDPLAERVKPSKPDFLLSGLEGIGWAIMAGLRRKRREAAS
jgi:hypothetical protein